MREDRFLSRCRDCGGDIAWIRTKGGSKTPVQIARRGGTAVHPLDTFAQGTHIHHREVCTGTMRRAQEIADRAPPLTPAAPPPAAGPSAPPPVGEMTEAALDEASAHYRDQEKRKPLGPRQAARLAEIEAERHRRKVDRIETLKTTYPWGDT